MGLEKGAGRATTLLLQGLNWTLDKQRSSLPARLRLLELSPSFAAIPKKGEAPHFLLNKYVQRENDEVFWTADFI